MNRIITRPFYCGKCEGQRKGQVALFGSHTQKLFIGNIEYRAKPVTPHLVMYNSVELRNKDISEITITVMCSVSGCGLGVIWEENGDFTINPKNAIKHLVPKQTLLDLIAYKDDAYFLTPKYEPNE